MRELHQYDTTNVIESILVDGVTRDAFDQVTNKFEQILTDHDTVRPIELWGRDE